MPKNSDKEVKTDELTAQECCQIAGEYMEKLDRQRGIFIKSGLFVFAALFVIAFASIAWFVNNKNVKSGSSAIKAIDGSFEIAAEGTLTDKGTFDDKLSATVTQGTEVTIDGKNYVKSDSNHTAISWAMTADSNIGNLGEDGVGIKPGATGKITFYILPIKSGEMHVKLDLSMLGFDDDNKVADDAACMLMEGHILLFAGYDNESDTYSGWISKDADTWELTLDDGTDAEPHQSVLMRTEEGNLIWSAEVTEGKAYPVSIYWIWPEVFGQYLFKDKTYIGNRPVMFKTDAVADAETVDPMAMPADLLAKMSDTSIGSGNSNRYFMWTSYSNEFASLVTTDSLANMRNGNFNPLIYGNMCTYYNMADQYLGEKVRYVNIVLDAK